MFFPIFKDLMILLEPFIPNISKNIIKSIIKETNGTCKI